MIPMHLQNQERVHETTSPREPTYVAQLVQDE